MSKLPEGKVVAAASDFTPAKTVNEAEYRGLLLCLDLLAGQAQRRIIICGDSNLVIRQITGEIDCKAPRLRLLNDRVMSALRGWPEHELVHVKRDWNKSADHLATLAMRDQVGVTVSDTALLPDLTEINRLPEIIHPANTEEVIQVSAVTRSQKRRSSTAGSLSPESMSEGIVQQLRAERILQVQDEEECIADLKEYLNEEVGKLTAEQAKECFKLAPDYEVDENGLLFFSTGTLTSRRSREINPLG